MSAAAGTASNVRTVIFLLFSLLLPAPWLLAASAGGMNLVPEVVAPLSGLAILGAALVLSWATELSERDLPQSLALLVLALVSVLPEYAIDLTFAIKAAEDPAMAHYAVANMTGANRLLIGLGWPAVVLLSCWRRGEQHLVIPPKHRLELRFLIYATLYSFVIPLKDTINFVDAAVLLGLFFWYVAAATQGEHEEVEHGGPAAWIEARTNDTGRRLIAIAMLAYATVAIFVAAEPFAEGLVELGHHLPIDEFVLVQWVAPLASESPEFLVTLLFAWKLRGDIGIGALISSKVNQWTLLVGALPIAFAIASGEAIGLPLDARQKEELFLTSAQSLLATLLIVDLDFSRIEAVLLAAAFLVQLAIPDAAVRLAFAWLYLALFLGLIIYSPERRAGFIAALRMRG